MSFTIPTVRVRREGGRGYHLINKAKYDANPTAYELVTDEAPAAATKPANDDGGDTGGKAPASDPVADELLKAARLDYEAVLGKKPYHGWDADQLREKIAAAKAAGGAAPQ